MLLEGLGSRLVRVLDVLVGALESSLMGVP